MDPLINKNQSHRFKKEIQVALLGNSNFASWQNVAIRRLQKSCNYLITPRGYEGEKLKGFGTLLQIPLPANLTQTATPPYSTATTLSFPLTLQKWRWSVQVQWVEWPVRLHRPVTHHSP